MYIRRFIKKQVTLAVITLSFLGVLILGSSYALFQKTIIDEKTQSISVGDLSISFLQKNSSGDFEDELVDSNAITLTNVMPKTDAEGIADESQVYTFAIYNSGTIAYSYRISLDDQNPKCTTEGCYDLYPYLRYKLNDANPVMLKDLAEGNACDEDSTNWSCQIYNYVINPGETHTFTLKIWLADAETYQIPNELLGQSGQININIEGEASNPRAPKGWNNAQVGTILYGIKQSQSSNTSGTNLTIPGQQNATTDEGLRSTEDDYGTSYYFRGAVENNYVSFANMCWRIVRITGDGSIKLVLYNYASGDCTTVGASNAFARYDGTNYKSNFNTTDVKNAYLGFMYGTPGSSTYEAEHANNTDSTILTRLKTWYDAKLNINISQGSTKKYTDYLADTIWCNDKRLGSTEASGYTNLGYNAEKTYYKVYDRLIPASSASPSLKCGDTTEDNKISKFTASDTVNGNGKLKGVNGSGGIEYKIGLLTADEVAFAGGIYNTANRTYYLYKNANDTWWYTMSPSFFNGTFVNVMHYQVQKSVNGYLSNGGVLGSGGIRPAVSLKSTATISGGNGEAGTPFVISY